MNVDTAAGWPNGGRMPTENENLRRQLSFAQAELRRIDRETAMLAISRREELRVEEEKKQREEQVQADEVALEEHRLNCHFNAMLDKALAGGSEALALFLHRSPDEHKARAPQGWPAGHSPAMYQSIPAAPPAPKKDAKPTLLGQMLAQKGVAI